MTAFPTLIRGIYFSNEKCTFSKLLALQSFLWENKNIQEWIKISVLKSSAGCEQWLEIKWRKKSNSRTAAAARWPPFAIEFDVQCSSDNRSRDPGIKATKAVIYFGCARPQSRFPANHTRHLFLPQRERERGTGTLGIRIEIFGQEYCSIPLPPYACARYRYTRCGTLIIPCACWEFTRYIRGKSMYARAHGNGVRPHE